MKILHVVEAWQGGIASYLHALIDEQSKRGHEVILAADAGLLNADLRELPCPVETYDASRSPTHLLSVRSSLIKILNRTAPDIVHAHSTFPGIYLRYPKMLHPRIIYTPHGWSFLKLDTRPWIRSAFGIIERVAAQRTPAIMCMSLNEVSAARAVGINSARLTLIHTGIQNLDESIQLGSPDNDGLLQDDALNIGFFGRLDYQKGADLLSSFADKLRDAKLHVFGAEVKKGKIIPNHPKIVRHGWIPHQRLHKCIASMDAIIIPSRWEGFSLTALEALRAGVPIIVSGHTSLNEVVIHGYNGLVMREYSNEHLAELVNGLTKRECQKMGFNAQRIYRETFTFERYYSKVDDLYMSLLRKR